LILQREIKTIGRAYCAATRAGFGEAGDMSFVAPKIATSVTSQATTCNPDG
jgi:hypothetical protein